MRVLFLSTWFPYPTDNGSKIRVYHLLQALGASHAVTLLSFAFDTAEPDASAPLHVCCVDIKAVHCNPFEVNRTNSLQRFLSWAPVFTRAIPKMKHLVQSTVTSTDFDAVIASTQAMATYAFQAPDSCTTVLEEHNSLTRMLWDRYQAQDSPLRRLQCMVSWQKARRYEATMFDRFDLITMVSEQDRKFSEQELPGYRGCVEVIPNGVDCRHNRPGLAQPQAGTLVFNGALAYSANHDAMQYFLAKIYPRIQDEEPGVSLTMTGSTTGVDLSRLRLDGSVRLSGHVEEVRPLVAGAWACVVPIRQGGGTRLKILEAMALGTPVVSTAKGAEGLAVTPERDILIADEPGDFAAQVVRLLREPGLRERLAHNARSLVEQRYDWQAIGQQFVRLVEAAVEEKRDG